MLCWSSKAPVHRHLAVRKAAKARLQLRLYGRQEHGACMLFMGQMSQFRRETG